MIVQLKESIVAGFRISGAVPQLSLVVVMTRLLGTVTRRWDLYRGVDWADG